MDRRTWIVFITTSLLACGVYVRAEPKLVYQTTSAYSTILVTEDPPGVRTLRFEEGGARQSVVKLGDPDHLELPYARTILVSLAFCDSPQRVLIVGLGGGTIPMVLRKHYPELTIDVVEIDPVVVDVARKFFGFREDEKMRVYVDDGRRFIERRRQLYDIIFLDAFSADSVPYHLATQEFLEAAGRATTPRGIIVGNIWSRSSNALYDSMIRTYQEVFDELYILGVPLAGNEIFIAPLRKRQIRREELARRAASIAREKGFRYPLGELASQAFKYAVEPQPHGRVLKDAADPARDDRE